MGSVFLHGGVGSWKLRKWHNAICNVISSIAVRCRYRSKHEWRTFSKCQITKTYVRINYTLNFHDDIHQTFDKTSQKFSAFTCISSLTKPSQKHKQWKYSSVLKLVIVL